MKSMSVSQKLARLKTLADEANQSILERIELAKQVCADTKWLGDNFQGDEGAARQYLQDKYFRQLAGWISLDKLFRMHAELASDVWAEYHFDLKAIESIYDEQQLADKEEAKPYTNWKQQAHDLQDQVEEVRFEANQSKKLVESLEIQVDRLREENAELRRENAELRGRLSELQRLIDKELSAA